MPFGRHADQDALGPGLAHQQFDLVFAGLEAVLAVLVQQMEAVEVLKKSKSMALTLPTNERGVSFPPPPERARRRIPDIA